MDGSAVALAGKGRTAWQLVHPAISRMQLHRAGPSGTKKTGQRSAERQMTEKKAVKLGGIETGRNAKNDKSDNSNSTEGMTLLKNQGTLPKRTTLPHLEELNR